MEEIETFHNHRKIHNNIRKILGLPIKNKKVKTTKNSLTSQRKYKDHSIQQKSFTPFERGLTLATMATSGWNSQPNPPQVYVFNRRVHHGEAGVLVGLYGLYKNDPELCGIGLGLALDDIRDINEWFTFKQRDFSVDQYASINYGGSSYNVY